MEVTIKLRRLKSNTEYMRIILQLKLSCECRINQTEIAGNPSQHLSVTISLLFFYIKQLKTNKKLLYTGRAVRNKKR